MRLIDADELIEHAWRDKLDSRELIAQMIENAHTIKEIPTKIPIDVFEHLLSVKNKLRPVTPQPKTDILDKIRTEIEKQEKWLLQAGYTVCNVDIAFDAIKSVLTESDDEE